MNKPTKTPELVTIERPSGEKVKPRWPIGALLDLFAPLDDDPLAQMTIDEREIIIRERYNLND